MASIQRSATRKRIFHGEEEAVDFLDVLKQLEGRAKVRVLEVFRLVQRAEELSSHIETRDGLLDYESSQMDELERLIKDGGRLNSLLGCYRARPTVYRYGVPSTGASVLKR